MKKISDEGNEVTFQFTRAHADTSVNCAIDELINTCWEGQKNYLGFMNIPVTQKSHAEVWELIKKKMHQDETTARTVLQSRFQSESSKNAMVLGMSREKNKRWQRMMKDDRLTQSLISNGFTDTAFRINGSRLRCPHCSTDSIIVPLSLEHIIYECEDLALERDEAVWSLPDNKESIENNYAQTDLFPNFVRSAKGKLTAPLKPQVLFFLEEIDAT